MDPPPYYQCAIITNTAWRTFFGIPPPLFSIKECLEKCIEENSFLGGNNARFFGMYQEISRCLTRNTGYYYDYNDLSEYVKKNSN